MYEVQLKDTKRANNFILILHFNETVDHFAI